MKIVVAGATGAIGNPLVDFLIQDGHEVYGITQSEKGALKLAGKGAKPLILDVLNRADVLKSIGSVKPDVVVDMLTRLPKEYTPEAMQQSAEMDGRIRIEGGANLLHAAESHHVGRYIAQSSAFWYAPGVGLANENVPFAFDAPPGIAAGTKQYAAIEQRVLQSSKIEGVALRFGFFYGPGTWFNPDGNMADQVKKGKFPIIGHGEGVWNFVHVEDAAKAIASAIYCAPGTYNIVNNHPAKMKEWLPAFARFLGADAPPRITEEEGLKEMGADSVYYATKLRGASNAKAKEEFNFQPRTFEWFL